MNWPSFEHLIWGTSYPANPVVVVISLEEPPPAEYNLVSPSHSGKNTENTSSNGRTKASADVHVPFKEPTRNNNFCEWPETLGTMFRS